MVWGTSRARRHSATPDPELADATDIVPMSARCAKCDTAVIMAAGKLPAGWVEKDGEAYCPDDAGSVGEGGRLTNDDDPASAPEGHSRLSGGQAASGARERLIAGKRRHVDIGPKGVRYTGCRIGSEIVHGLAEIELRAGASPPPGRDERVRFLLDGPALDELIIELSAIRRGLPNG